MYQTSVQMQNVEQFTIRYHYNFTCGSLLKFRFWKTQMLLYNFKKKNWKQGSHIFSVYK